MLRAIATAIVIAAGASCSGNDRAVATDLPATHMSLRPTIGRSDRPGFRQVRWSVTNTSTKRIVLDWRRFNAVIGTEQLACWGDDSQFTYTVPAGQTVHNYGGCYLPAGDQRPVSLRYGDVELAVVAPA